MRRNTGSGNTRFPSGGSPMADLGFITHNGNIARCPVTSYLTTQGSDVQLERAAAEDPAILVIPVRNFGTGVAKLESFTWESISKPVGATVTLSPASLILAGGETKNLTLTYMGSTANDIRGNILTTGSFQNNTRNPFLISNVRFDVNIIL